LNFVSKLMPGLGGMSVKVQGSGGQVRPAKSAILPGKGLTDPSAMANAATTAR